MALNDLNDYASDTLHLYVENFVPELTSISDVPNDQGGRVYVSFNSSFFDNGETNGQSYSLFRHDTFENDSSGWVALTSIDAVGDSEYTFEASTLRDSTSDNNKYTYTSAETEPMTESIDSNINTSEYNTQTELFF